MDPGNAIHNHALLPGLQVPLFATIRSSTGMSSDAPSLALEEGGHGVLRLEGRSSQDLNLVIILPWFDYATSSRPEEVRPIPESPKENHKETLDCAIMEVQYNTETLTRPSERRVTWNPLLRGPEKKTVSASCHTLSNLEWNPR